MARVLAILIGCALYAILVVWARGAQAFSTITPLSALAVVYLALCIAALFVGGSLSPGLREDRGNRWVLPVFGLLGLATAIFPAWDDAHDFSTFGGDSLRWLGVVLVALGGALRLWPVVVLGHRFSGLVAIQPGHRLQTSGLYSKIRHPSYLGLLVASLGWVLAFRSGLGLLLVALLIPPVLARIKAEENLLASEFGPEYEAYRARTSKMIPGLW
jgi:protein-S-isoprenylcysteine O-methyltransferase Ste14